MMNGWIKWHLQTLDNDVFLYDPTAWRIFEYLCLMAYKNRPQGCVVTGRDKIANTLGGNSSTVYKALKRLESNNMIEVSVTGRRSVINICNWDKFQANGNTSSNNSVTTKEQQSNPLNKNKIKNKNISTNVDKSKSDDIQRLYDLFIQLFGRNENQYKLTVKRKAKLSTRLNDAGFEMVEQAIRKMADSPFHRGDNDRGWQADLDWIIKSYEQVERLSQHTVKLNEDAQFEQERAALEAQWQNQ